MEKQINLKPLISCHEELYISTEGKKENALEVKVVCLLPIPLYTGEITLTVGRCRELEELFA